jgi:hypothetical protein
MKLTKLYFENYKAFAGEHELELRPLTIIIGRNNSGKSALTRLPLLLRDLVNSDAGVSTPTPDPATAHQLFHGQPLAGRMKLGWSLDHRDKLLLGYETIREDGEQETLLNSIQVDEQKFKAQPIFHKNTDEYTINITIDNLPEKICKTYPGPINSPHLNQMMMHFDVSSYFRIEGIEDEPDPEAEELVLTYEQRFSSFNEKIKKLGDISVWPRISHLPAVRDKPSTGAPLTSKTEAKHYYAWSASALFSLSRNKSPIFDNIRSWFKDNLGGYALEVEQSSEGIELLLRHPEHNTPVHITNTGAGMGQVLPLIIYCLSQRPAAGAAAPPSANAAEQAQDRLLIVEEPESHLHPGAHGALADLFVDLIKTGHHQTIVETHSEVFCLRMQRRVAEDTVKPENVVIYWVDQDPKLGRSSITPIFISEKGETYIWRDGKRIRYWPKGVFSEDADEIRALHELQAAQR